MERSADTEAMTLHCYAQACIRPMLHTCPDPYGATTDWPASTHSHPMYAVNTWLAGIADADTQTARKTAARQVLALWADYAEMAVPRGADGQPQPVEADAPDGYLPHTWDAIPTVWPDPDPNALHTLALPLFCNEISRRFNLACYALAWLNKRCKRPLTDLGVDDE